MRLILRVYLPCLLLLIPLVCFSGCEPEPVPAVPAPQIGMPAMPPREASAPLEVLVKEDFEITVTFHWMDSGSDWRIVDVSFDGASLVKDYQNQFGRIIDKEGAKGLLKRMVDRLQEEESKRGKMP